jgi:hypothetical protein
MPIILLTYHLILQEEPQTGSLSTSQHGIRVSLAELAEFSAELSPHMAIKSRF